MSDFSRAVLTVDVGQICRNYQHIRDTVAPCQVMAVLKANAYGLGLREVAQSLLQVGVDRFGVACLEEALAIHDLGVPVQILGAVLPEEVHTCVANNIIIPISDPRLLAQVTEQSQQQNTVAKIHVLIDTGMGRLGVQPNHTLDLMRQAHQAHGVILEGIYSHFPSAYDDRAFSLAQIRNVLDIKNRSGIQVPLLHIANSDGVNNIPEACAAPFNMVRVGINLYGYFDSVGQRRLAIRPAVTLKAKLAAVRLLPAGACVGYGRTYQLHTAQRIGTLALGYADGLPLQMNQGGEVLVNGQRCPIVGRVSMDYATVLLDTVPEAQVGDWVTCLGDGLELETWARKKQTIPYDIICALGQRVKRDYVPSED